VVGKDRPADESLFYMGLIYADYSNPEKDYNRSVNYFEKVIDKYPQSRFLEQARIWTGVLKGMEKLKRDDPVITNEHILCHLLEQAKIMIGILNVIEKVKQVDIEIDKKRKEMTGQPWQG
jgi:hypothetical protein